MEMRNAETPEKEASFPEALQEVLGYSFRDPSYLILALTHTSYANERGRKAKVHNERLEFLGDAVLELVSSEYLYHVYPKKPEGELTKIRASMVCEPTLAQCARELTIDRYLLLGKGEEMTGGRSRDSIVSDALEAVIGAVYLDGGFSEARKFIRDHILKGMEERSLFRDSKTLLQEMVQEADGVPVYTMLGEEGPDHRKTFRFAVSVDGKTLGIGEGHSKKAAEQKAAAQAIQRLKEGNT